MLMNTAVTDITNILIDVSKNCLKLNKTQKERKRTTKSKGYFDSECYLKSKELQRLGRLLSSDPNNISIRNTYFQTKKQYKNMIKLKKRNSKEDSDKEDPAKEIDLKRWKDYFQNLYNSNETNDNVQKSFDYKGNQNRIDRADFDKMKKLLNCPFTKKEILACKEKLKGSKASGVDMIKNEVLKICFDNKGFLESLQLLFNKILIMVSILHHGKHS